MFYFDSDKIEIKGWIKRDILILQSRIEQVESFQKSSDIFAEVEKYVLNQLAQNNAEYIAQISMLKKEIENLKSKSDSTAALQAEISDLRNKNKIPEDKIASLKPESTAALQAEISDLRNKNKILENKIANLKPESIAALQAEISDLRNKNKILEDKIASLKPESTASLQAEISDLRNQNKILSSKNFALETEIKKIWQEIKKSAAEKITVQTPVQIPIQEKTESKIEISSPPPVESPEKFFTCRQMTKFLLPISARKF